MLGSLVGLVSFMRAHTTITRKVDEVKGKIRSFVIPLTENVPMKVRGTRNQYRKFMRPLVALSNHDLEESVDLNNEPSSIKIKSKDIATIASNEITRYSKSLEHNVE
jgi:hypothetical protein